MEVITISPNSDKSQENMRFYYGWGALACVFGLALLIFASTGNLVLAIALFFILLGVSLVLISISEPVLPLLITFGGALILLGLAVYGIFVALFNPVILIGVMIIAVGGLVIVSAARRKCWK
jgi:hypothetical protein